MWKYYYSKLSTAEHGTLYQLRNALHRTNVVNVPIDSFDACEDFFVLIVESHIVVAAMRMLEMNSTSDIPSAKYAPDGEDTWMLIEEERQNSGQDYS